MTWLRIAWVCDPLGVLARAVLLVAALACIVNNCGCRTLTIEAPRLVEVRCRKTAPGRWRVVVDGAERFRLTFPGDVPEVLPCPPK